MPRATSRAIDPVGITSTGARSSLPSRMTEPFPNCRSIWARADSRAFSRSAGDGMACSLCSRSVACRLSRSVSRAGGDAATRRVVSFDVVHARGGLRHRSSLLPVAVDRHVLDTCCAGAYAAVERTFDDTPGRNGAWREVSRDAARGVRRRSGARRARRSRRTARATPHGAGCRHAAPRRRCGHRHPTASDR